MKKRLLFGICFLLLSGIPVIELRAEEPAISIVREDGISILIKEGELYYTNAPLRFIYHARPEEEAVYEYALSGDDGIHYSEWIPMEEDGYLLVPDLENEVNGIWQIKFRKIEEDKKEEMESRSFRIGFDLCPPECSLLSEQVFAAWSAKDILCDLTGKEDKSGIRSISVETDGELLYEREYSQSEEVREFETELVLSKEARSLDGLRLEIAVTDYAGNTQTIKETYYIDKTRPTVQLSGILAGTIQKEPVIVEAKAQDNHPTGVILVYRAIRTMADGQSFVEEQIAEGGKRLEQCYQTDGNYEVLCYAVDPAGNRSDEAKVTFRVDSTSPVIQIGGVSDGTDYQEGKSVSVTLMEAFFSDCCVEVSAKRRSPGHEEGVFLPVWKIQEKESRNCYYFEEDGDYVISVRAVDAAGNQTERRVSFRVDRHAPTLFIQGLSEKTVTNQPPKLLLNVEELFYDTTQIRCRLIKKTDKGVFVPIEMPEWTMETEKAEFPIEINEEGGYVLQTIVTDRTGNQTEEQLSFTLDYTPPVIGFLDSLHQKYVTRFQLPADFSSWISDLTMVSCKAYLNTRNFLPQEEVTQEGKYILRIEAVDEAGNTAEKTIAFIVDRTVPRVVVSGIRRDGTVGKNEKITLCLYEEEDRFVSVLLDGVEQTLAKEGKWAVFSIKEYGDHNIAVKAIDLAQNVLEQEISMNCVLAANPLAGYQVKEQTVEQKEDMKQKEDLKQKELPASTEVTRMFAPKAVAAVAVTLAAGVLLLTGTGIFLYKRKSLRGGGETFVDRKKWL